MFSLFSFFFLFNLLLYFQFSLINFIAFQFDYLFINQISFIFKQIHCLLKYLSATERLFITLRTKICSKAINRTECRWHEFVYRHILVSKLLCVHDSRSHVVSRFDSLSIYIRHYLGHYSTSIYPFRC